MKPPPPLLLEMPSCLFGSLASVRQKALGEGHRCAEHYRESGSVCLPRELQALPAGETVIVEQAVDLVHERPAWRLYMVGDFTTGLCTASEWRNSQHLREVYESLARETAWGALYYAISGVAPYDAACYAARFQELLRHWEALTSAQYLFWTPTTPGSLERLVTDSCGWAANSWSPDVTGDIRRRLQAAAERMARATREDCIAAVLRQIPHALPLARGLKHPHVFADLEFWRERLASMDEQMFSRVSAAWPSNVLQRMYVWDRQLGVH